jgi:hypothetical protein
MRDKREIRCVDVKEDGEFWLLVKRAGTIREAKANVVRIERIGTVSTQPSSRPAQ